MLFEIVCNVGFTITQFFQVLKYKTVFCAQGDLFYDNSILSGTKIIPLFRFLKLQFYDNSILSGTKIQCFGLVLVCKFYDNSILSGTKIERSEQQNRRSFTITQFFQVLKYQISKSFSSIFKNSPLLFFKNAISRLLTSVSNTVS